MKTKAGQPRRCKLCGRQEKRLACGPYAYTTISRGLGICTDCINVTLKEKA